MKHDFTKDLLDTVSKILNPVSEQSCEDDMKKPSKRKSKREDDEDEDEDEMKEGYVSHAQRKAVWANRADDGKGHPDKKKKMKKEGYVPTADEPSEKDKQTAQKVRDLLAKEKKPVKPVKEAAERQISRDEFHKAGGHNNRAQYTTGDEKNKKYWTRSPKNEEVELEEGKMKELVTKHMDDGHDYDAAMKKAKKDLEKMKEEAEQIDEISKAMMGRYINKAKNSIDTTSWRQGHREGSKFNYSGRFKEKLARRHKGIETAVNKLTKEENDYLETDLKKRKKNNDKAIKDMKKMGSPMKNPAFGEEVEQIDELSKGKLAKYIGSAEDSADELERKAIKGDDKSWRKMHKRLDSTLKAKHKWITAKEEAEQIDELSKKTLGSYVKKAAGHAAGSAAASAAIASSSNPKVPQKVKRDLRNRMTGISKATDKLTKEEQEFIDSLNNEMFEEIEIAEANLKVGDYTASSEKSKFHDKGYRPHLKNPQGKTSYLAAVAYKSPEHAAGEAAAYHKGYTSGPGKASERGANDAVRAYRHKNKEHMHEEVISEEDDGWYTHSQIHGSKRSEKHPKGISAAEWKSGIRWDHRNNKRINVKEEAEQIEMTEARGRPRKDAGKDFTIHPKTKEKLMHNNPAHMKRIENLYRIGTLKKPKTEADQNIITQLRKASTSMTGDHKVNFSHGAATHVSGTHAAKILDKHASMKPAEKEAFQKEIGHSYENLKKHI